MPEDSAEALAIDGGTPLRTAAWPEPPAIAPAEDIAPLAALESEFAAALGLAASAVVAYRDQAAAFDAAFATLTPVPGHDEAVVPALLGEALAAAARRNGWRPVPAEVEPDAATLSARGLARAIGPATGIVGLAHSFGHPPVLADIARVAQEAAAAVIEDASDGFGAAYRDEAVGRFGRAVFALGAGRVLSGGAPDRTSGGGLLVLRDATLAEAARAARDASGGVLDEAAARIALAELRRSGDELQARRQLAWELTFGLRGVRGLASMTHGRWIRHAYDRYVVRLRAVVWKRSLDETIAAIRAEGIPCEAAAGPPLYLDPAVREALPGDERLGDDHFPAAGRLFGELIAFPLHGGLTSKDMDQVAAVLRKVERWST